jgi:hypothetical protein
MILSLIISHFPAFQKGLWGKSDHISANVEVSARRSRLKRHITTNKHRVKDYGV